MCGRVAWTRRLLSPPQYSRRAYSSDAPRIGLVVDTSDQFMSSSIEGEMQSLIAALNVPVIQDRVVKKIALNIVELYPYVEFMKYLLVGSISLAMYVSVMIGGGMLYIDDKARGVLKDGGVAAIQGDLFFLYAFGIGTLLIATPLFKRTM